jgi:hypothetical protein
MSRPTSPRPRKPRRRFSSASISTQPLHDLDQPSLKSCDDSLHRQRREIYFSLPPTPISTSPPLRLSTPPPNVLPVPPKLQVQPDAEPPFSLWDYLREELLATDFDSHQELKWERLSNFLSIPLAIEKVLLLPFILHPVGRRLMDSLDYWLWLHFVSGFLPVHVYYNANTFSAGLCSLQCRRLPPLRPSIATLTKGRSVKDAATCCFSSCPESVNGCEQNLSQNTWTGHH